MIRAAPSLHSVYDRCGGFAAVSGVVMTFYEHVLDSDRIGRFFEDVDMPKLIDHQTRFIAHIMGGPTDFAAARLERAHRRLGIDDGDVDEIKRLLDRAMRDHGLAAEDRAVVLAAVEAHRSLVVAPEGRS